MDRVILQGHRLARARRLRERYVLTGDPRKLKRAWRLEHDEHRSAWRRVGEGLARAAAAYGPQLREAFERAADAYLGLGRALSIGMSDDKFRVEASRP